MMFSSSSDCDGLIKLGFRFIVQNHELFRTQAERPVSAAIAIAEFDFECLAVLQNLNHGAHLAPPEIMFGHIDREGHIVKKLDSVFHSDLFKVLTADNTLSAVVCQNRVQ